MNLKKDAAEGSSSASAALKVKRYYPLFAGSSQGQFDRRKLPHPISILSKLGISPGRPNAAGYLVLRCPFHKNGTEKKPSLNLHLVNGNFRCHACGVSGGDILAFFMQMTGSSFVKAAKELGAWRYNV